jgi:hypothetical protein
MARKKMKIKLKKGALHRQLGIAPGKKIPAGTLQHLTHSSNVRTRRRAVFALNARKWRH